MGDLAPANHLDRALMAMRRSQAAMPDLMRRLTAGELWFLIPYHPELEGEDLELKNGSPLPFAMLEDGQGCVVPLFSSEARLEEGLAKGHVPPRTFSAAALPALQVLGILGKANLRAVLNKSCATGQVILPPNLMRDLADGTALSPLPAGPAEQGQLRILDPADYPTNLIQPVFEHMKRHRNFRAAWVFGFADSEPEPAGGRGYRLLFLMEPRDDALLHEVNLIAQAAVSETDALRLGLVDETSPACLKELFGHAAPFYAAVDYRPPSATS